MIIVGYPGVGKSSVAANQFNNFIDLESNNFFYEKEGIMVRDEDWYKPYCKIAVHLSSQGFNVFVSSHNKVRDELKKYDEKVIAVCPSLKLKDKWINRLKQRYNKSKSEKDMKALIRAEANYEYDVNNLISSIDDTLIIENTNYDLEEILNDYMVNKFILDKE